MASYTTDLKNLIIMLDQNKQTLANAQYALRSDTEEASVMKKFSNNVHTIRQMAFQQIKDLLFEAFRWNADTIDEDLGNYCWSLVYPLYRACTLENFAEKITDALTQLSQFISLVSEYVENLDELHYKASDLFNVESMKLELFLRGQIT